MHRLSAKKTSAFAAAALALGLMPMTAALAAPSGTVAFLMPDQASTRYEQHDFPGFKAEMAKLCADCKLLYQNANGDVAQQQQQFNSALSQGAKVIVLDPVDSTSAASLVKLAQGKGVKVIAYDRPIPSTPADYYVSFDNEGIGKAIADSLVKHLKEDMKVPTEKGGLLQVNGSPTDAAAGLIKKGIHAGLDSSGYKILAEYDTPEWAPPKAQQWVSGQITRFPGQIVGVVAANDGTGGGTIAAFKAAGVNPQPPVTGNDATLAALQLIVAGRPIQHDLQAKRDRRRGCRTRRGRLPHGPGAQGRHAALQHALAAVHAGGRHAEEPEGRDHRQEDRRRQAAVHRPLRRRLQEDGHRFLSDRP